MNVNDRALMTHDKTIHSNRRAFLRTGALAASSFLLPTARAQEPPGRFDRYGGLRSVKFEATGYFRIEKRERWWFVTPEGHGWLGFGVNHVHPAWLRAPYNREVWLQRFGAQRPDDAAWQTGLRELVKTQMAAVGYNHFGVHNDLRAVAGLSFPEIRSIAFVNIPHNRVATATDFPDVFAPTFEAHCEALAEQVTAPHRDNPLVIGWAFTDCPILTDAEAAARPVVTHGSPREACPTWPRVLRNLPADASGKQVWVATIRQRYADNLNAFNDCYGVSFKSWNELLATTRWREVADVANARELADNREFLHKVVDRYYAVACAALRRHAPHQLVFGDKLNGNTDGADTVVQITSRYTDVVFYQMYDRWAQQVIALDRWRGLTGKPVFNGDGTFSTTSEMMPNPHGPHARDQAERGEWAYEFGSNAFARPDFIGWSVCGWVDTWRTMPGKEFKQHSGFFSPQGEPHSPYVQRLKELSDRLYEFAQAKIGLKAGTTP